MVATSKLIRFLQQSAKSVKSVKGPGECEVSSRVRIPLVSIIYVYSSPLVHSEMVRQQKAVSPTPLPSCTRRWYDSVTDPPPSATSDPHLANPSRMPRQCS